MRWDAYSDAFTLRLLRLYRDEFSRPASMHYNAEEDLMLEYFRSCDYTLDCRRLRFTYSDASTLFRSKYVADTYTFTQMQRIQNTSASIVYAEKFKQKPPKKIIRHGHLFLAITLRIYQWCLQQHYDEGPYWLAWSKNEYQTTPHRAAYGSTIRHKYRNIWLMHRGGIDISDTNDKPTWNWVWLLTAISPPARHSRLDFHHLSLIIEED